MSLETEGFVRKDPLVRMEEIKRLIKQYIPQVDLSEGEILFQLIKIAAMREENMQIAIQQLVDNLSMGTAYGEYLRAHAANVGAYPSYGAKAIGNLLVTTTVDATTTIPQYTIFTSSDGIEVLTTFQMTAYYSIPVTRATGTLADTISVQYQITDIDWIDSSSDGTGTEYTDFTFDDGVITWGSTKPADGVIYFIRPVGGVLTIVIPVRAAYFGSSGNLAADMDLTSPDDPTLTAIVDSDGITGGTDVELDDVTRARANAGRFRNRTSDALKTLIENLDGVDECAIQEVQGVDLAIPASWPDDKPNGVTFSRTTNVYCLKQKFSPGEGVASIRSVDLWLGKPGVDYRGSLDIYLLDANEGELDHHTITNDDFDYTKGTSYQLINVPLRAAPLYNTTDYYIEVSNTSACWGVGIAVSKSTSLDQLYLNDVKYENTDLAFRTKYLANYYDVQVLPIDGYSFTDVEASIESLLSDEESGFSISGVDHVISEIDQNYIRVNATVYTKKNYDWSSVSSAISNAVGTYIDALGIGEPVIYNGIVGAMMGVTGVSNIHSVFVYKDSVEVSNSTNENSVVMAKDAKAVQDTNVVTLTHGNP